MPSNRHRSMGSLAARTRASGRLGTLGIGALALLAAVAAACGDESGDAAATGASASDASSGNSSSNGTGGDQGFGGDFPNGAATTTDTSTTATTSTTGAGGADPCESVPQGGGDYVWAKNFGDASDQSVAAVAIDGSGNVVITGALSGSVNFGGATLTSAGSTDVFIAKFDALGNHVWSKSFGSAKAQTGTGIAVDSGGNVIVTGFFYETMNLGGGTLTATSNGSANSFTDVFVAKFDAAGNHVWSKRFGNINTDFSSAVTVDSGNNILVVGKYQTPSIDFGGGALPNVGGFDAFVAKLDSGGNYVWAKGYGDATEQSANDVEVDAFGNVYVTGDMQGSVNFGGVALTAPSQSAFLVKLSGAGAHTWSKRFGEGKAIGVAVASNAAGDAFLLGDFNGAMDLGTEVFDAGANDDLFLLHLDPQGVNVWNKRYGDTLAQHAGNLAIDASGGPVLTGYFGSKIDFGGGALTSVGSFDVFLAKLDSKGCHVQSQAWGSTLYEAGEAIALDGTGNAVIGGSFSGAVDFGGGVLTASGTDVLLAKFAP